jgi:hypothetical protein
LVAPVSVNGIWKMNADAARLATLPCVGSVASANSFMVISQSGESLAVNLSSVSKTTASGNIEGNTVKVTMAPSPDYNSETGCNSERLLTLTATVDPKSDPRSLSGVLSVAGCSTCGSVDFKAVRQPRNAAGGGH